MTDSMFCEYYNVAYFVSLYIELMLFTVNILFFFPEQFINGEALLELSESDLKELQIKLGPRKIIKKFLYELKCKSTVSLLCILYT